MSLNGSINEPSKLKKKRNEPGMFMKTKERCGKKGNEPGMSMKTQGLSF
jgi:hypothetical protein